jgi:hypothetical protein
LDDQVGTEQLATERVRREEKFRCYFQISLPNPNSRKGCQCAAGRIFIMEKGAAWRAMYPGGMGRALVIAGMAGERSAGLIAPSYVAVNGTIPFVDRIVNVFPGAGAPTVVAGQWPDRVPVARSCNLKSHTADTQLDRKIETPKLSDVVS